MASARHDPVMVFVGAALMAIGGLIAALCGTCTLLATAGLLIDLAEGQRNGGADYGINFWTVAAIGGLPTLVGLGMFLGGRSLGTSAMKPPPKFDDV